MDGACFVGCVCFDDEVDDEVDDDLVGVGAVTAGVDDRSSTVVR